MDAATVYNIFHVIIALLIGIGYAVIVYWVVPTYIPKEDQAMVENYTTFALTIILTFLTAGSITANYLVEKKGGGRIRW